jgi:hypothetical protein
MSIKKTNLIYHNFKGNIKEFANDLHKEHKTDNAAIREGLNNYLDNVCRDLEHFELKEELTTKRKDLFIEWLTNYTILRHDLKFQS